MANLSGDPWPSSLVRLASRGPAWGTTTRPNRRSAPRPDDRPAGRPAWPSPSRGARSAGVRTRALPKAACDARHESERVHGRCAGVRAGGVCDAPCAAEAFVRRHGPRDRRVTSEIDSFRLLSGERPSRIPVRRARGLLTPARRILATGREGFAFPACRLVRCLGPCHRPSAHREMRRGPWRGIDFRRDPDRSDDRRLATRVDRLPVVWPRRI